MRFLSMPRREMFPAGNKRKQKPQDPRLSAWAVCSLHSAFLVAKPLHRTTRLYKCVDDCLFLAVSFSGSRCGFPRLGIWQVPLHRHSSIRKGRGREREERRKEFKFFNGCWLCVQGLRHRSKAKASTKHQAAKRCVYDGFHGLVQSLSSTCQTAKKCTLANVPLEKLEKFNKPRR